MSDNGKGGIEDSKEGDRSSAMSEQSDEFLRNFFIKFGMKKTLDSFQQEWCELKANHKLDGCELPEIPEIYRRNADLSD